MAGAAAHLNTLRERWLNPPEWCDRVPEVTPLGLERMRRYRDSDECFATTNYLARNPSPPSWLGPAASPWNATKLASIFVSGPDTWMPKPRPWMRPLP